MSDSYSTHTPPVRKPSRAKPSKPYPDFPLTINPCGYYSKKIRGKVHYFGRWDQGPEHALAEWERQKEDLLAGRDPKPVEAEQVFTIRTLLNDYRNHKERAKLQGRITGRTLQDAIAVCDFLAKHFQKQLTRAVSDLGPRDFNKVMDALLSRHREGKAKSAVVLGNEIGRIKQVFHFAVKVGKLDRLPTFGPEFTKPPAASVEKQRQELTETEGERTFSREEILSMLLFASGPLESMILLAVNCGLGNSDIGQLKRSHLQLDSGWLVYPRPKNQKPRKCWLWPETVAALNDWLAVRPEPKNSAHDRIVYITKYGLPWHKESTGENPLSSEFKKLLVSLGINGGRNFYNLRATYRTEAAACLDSEAIFYTMGHALPGMSKHYVKHVHDERLQKVAQTVRTWLVSGGCHV